MRLVASVLAAAAAASCTNAARYNADDWQHVGQSPRDTTLDLVVALKEQNLDALDEAFWAISTPGSERYGRFLTSEQISELTAPSGEDAKAVADYFEARSVKCELTQSKVALACTGKVSDVEALFSTEVHQYSHATTSRTVHRIPATASFSFPSELEGKVQMVTGLTQLPAPHYGAVAPDAGAGTGYVTPSTLATAYGIDIPNAGHPDVVQSAIEFQGLPAYSPSDVDKFSTNVGLPENITIAQKFGPFFDLLPETESELDVQYLGAVGYGNTNWYWTESSWMYTWANTLLGNSTEAPDVASISYGWAEDDQCSINAFATQCKGGGAAASSAYVAATNTAFQKLGAMGVTLVVASGDSGAHGRSDGYCSKTTMTPTYPGASPYVTTVGATQFTDGAAHGHNKDSPFCEYFDCLVGNATEVVCSTGTGALITSGGGFSNVASTPSYQSNVVSSYLSTSSNTPGAGNFNSTGRGYPDVAALGHGYYVQYFGLATPVDGTSCATPVFAGVLANINAARVKAGKSKIGFANPLLYSTAASNPSIFTDITTGSNACTENTCDKCKGFQAAKGWDATTGLGTPNFPEMVKAMV